MSAIRTIAALAGLLAAGLCAGQSQGGVVIDVSRAPFIETVANPERLMEAILDAVSTSQRTEQESLQWDDVFDGPNWIHVQFAPGRMLRRHGGSFVAPMPVTEILISFPTREAVRRWPDYILVKTDVGAHSRAKWSHDQMCEIAVEAGFDPGSIAPFDDRCSRTDLQ